jgi:hypothetical protein
MLLYTSICCCFLHGFGPMFTHESRTWTCGQLVWHVCPTAAVNVFASYNVPVQDMHVRCCSDRENCGWLEGSELYTTAQGGLGEGIVTL